MRMASTREHVRVFLLFALSVRVFGYHQKPRVTFMYQDVKFPRSDLQTHSMPVKLVRGLQENTIYAGCHQQLSLFNFQTDNLAVEDVPMFQDECSQNPSECLYNITMLKEGKDGNPLFFCGTNNKDNKCCYMNSTHSPVNCSQIHYSLNVTEPSLHIGEALYSTYSGRGEPGGVTVGLYRTQDGTNIWPRDSQTEQWYVSIAARRGREKSLHDKLYAFYTEKSLDKNPESDLWIPRVSQICLNDQGGSKDRLQLRWASRLSARLACGDAGKKLYFTELLDVFVLEAERWDYTRVYALFTNGWGMRAVCIYTMADIDHIFSNSTFKVRNELNPLNVPSPRPGKCVRDSTSQPSSVLMFMEKHPEMKDWVQPENSSGPLLVSHHHYTHIQVDRVANHTVLLLALERGAVHKVLEKAAGQSFIIAEIQPFTRGTRILHTLLDSSMRKLYVSSSREVVQIDLHSCGQYGDQCEDCVMARDPYCGWYRDQCTVATENTTQDVQNGNYRVCEGLEVISPVVGRSPVVVPSSSKIHLRCKMQSSHALYSWRHHGNETACVHAESQCLLLIDSMSAEHQGSYQCRVKEGEYEKMLVHYVLQMKSGAAGLSFSHLATAGLLLLLSVLG